MNEERFQVLLEHLRERAAVQLLARVQLLVEV